MRRLYCFALRFLLLTVGAEKADFQGYHAEQTKGTNVTKDLLLKRENTIGHGTEAIPTERTHRHTAVAVTAMFLRAVLFGTRPSAPHETTEMIKASAIIASQGGERFVSRNGQNSLTSMRDNSSAIRIHTELEMSLISNYEKIVFPPTQAAFKSIMNGTFKPEIHLSADAVKAPLWLRTLLDNRNQRSSNSITLTSADGGPGVPILSASRPRVIDNLAALRNHSDDKQSHGKNEKGISNFGRNEYPHGTWQSIFQSDTAEDSVKGNAVTNLRLTCQKDRIAAATEKSVALPAPSHDGSSDSRRTEELPLHFTQFATSLPSSHQQAAGEQEEIPNKDISHQNLTKHSSFDVRKQPVYNVTFPPLSFDKSVNHSRSMSNNSQIKSFLSDAGTAAFDTQSLAEMSSVTQKDTRKYLKHTYPSGTLVTERPISTTAPLCRSSKSETTAEQEIGNIGDPPSKQIDFSKDNKNASHSLSTNFKNVFIQNQHLDFNIGSVIKKPVIAEAPHSSQKSVLPEGSTLSAASHSTERRMIEAHSAQILFSLSRPSTSTVKNPESHSLISVFKSQTPAKPGSQTKVPILTLSLKNSATKFAPMTAKTRLTERHDSQTFNSINSIVKQSFVAPSGPTNKPVMEEPQTATFTTSKAAVPVKSSLSEPRRDFDDDVSTMTLTTLSSKSVSERLTSCRRLGTQSKRTYVRTFDVGNDNDVAPTQHKREPLIVHKLKPEDNNEEMSTAVAEDGDRRIKKREGKQGEEIKETKPIRKLQEREKSREDEKLNNKREGLVRSDEAENGKAEKTINLGVEIIQNTDRDKNKINKHKTKRSREAGAGTREQDVTLGQKKRQQEMRDEEGAKRKSPTKINSTRGVAGKQREGAGVRREETASKEDIEHNREAGEEDMTNVRLGPTTNCKEHNRDKGHTVTKLSPRHSLIKQLGATENKGSHLGENTAQIEEMKNKPFSYKTTSGDRPLHSTVRSQSPKRSRMTSFPKEPHTQIKPHPLMHMLTEHGATSSLARESTQSKVIGATSAVTVIPELSQTFGVSTSKFSDALKPMISPHSSATKSAHPALNSISRLSLSTPRVRITAGFPRAHPHFTLKSSTISVSIIHSVSDRNTFSASGLKANSILRTTNEREQADLLIPAHAFDSGVQDPLTSNRSEVNTLTSVNPALLQQMYSDSSTRPLTASTLTPGSHISISQLQPHRGQSVPQMSQSSSFDVTSGQPCSFKLSEQTAHSDVEGNEQRSVHTLMASMSPRANNDQFPLRSMTPRLNLRTFGTDSFPGTYSVTGLTRSASEKEISWANSDTEFEKSGSGHDESLSGTADETNQTEDIDSVQNMVTLAEKHSDVVTNQMAEKRDEKNSSPVTAQQIGRSKYHARHTDQFNSLSVKKTEKLAVINTNENNHNDLFNLDGNDEANNTVKTILENNLSQLEGDTVTSTKPIVIAIQTTHTTERLINGDFVPVTTDFAIPVLDTNDQSGTTESVELDGVPELPKIQAKDVTNRAISHMQRYAAKTTEKKRATVGDDARPLPHNSFRSDLKVPNISAQQIADRITNVSSTFQTVKTNDFVSLLPTASISGLTVSTEAHNSTLTTIERVQAVTEKSSQATHDERMVQSNSYIEPFSLREPPTIGKFTPAVKRRNSTETQSVEQPEHETSIQDVEQSQHASPAMFSVTRPIRDPGHGVQAGLINRAGGTRDTTPTMLKRVEYSSFKDIDTKSAFEHPPHERTPTVHTLDITTQHKKNALAEKTTINQVILGAVTDSVPPTGISPTEIHNKTSCRSIGCAKSGETTETTIGAGEMHHAALEKTHKTQAGHMGRDRFNAPHTPSEKTEIGNCSSDRSVPGTATPQATNSSYAVLSPATSNSGQDHGTVEGTATKNANSLTNKTLTKMRKTQIKTDHLERCGTLEQAQFAAKTTQRHPHRLTSEAQEVTLSQPEATTVQTAERTLHTERNTKTQLNRGAAKAGIYEAQNATRSARAVSKGETGESVRRLLLLEPGSESELQRLKHRRSTSPHLYLSGVTEVSDDLCGSGNYTAQMSLNLGKGVEPGDAVPASGNLRVVINLQTNSRINLEVTSCCLSPTIQPDLSNSTCCLFSRLAAEPAGITRLPSALSTSASFTISLFQMINYSVVYLHCDLSVCPRNRSDCERQCLQQRSASPSEGPEAVVTNYRNRISFGPMLKEVNNSTFPEETDSSELDLVLVIVSLVVSYSLVSVTLLLVWLAYRRCATWLLHPAAPPPACCGCLHPGSDLILP